MVLKKMNFKRIGIAVGYSLVLLAGGFYFGTQNYTSKTTQVEKNRLKQDIKIVEKIVIKKSGEKIIYRTRTEKKDERGSKSVVTIKKDRDWLAGLSYGQNLSGAQIYTLSVDRKIFSGVYVGVFGTSNKQYGVGVKIAF